MTAVWKPNVYSVNFNANGGINAPAVQNLVFGNDAIFSPDVKAMTRQGYTFNGWYLDSACKVPFDYFNKKMDENTLSSLTKAGAIDSKDTITLYAGWKAAATPSATASTPANNNRGSTASTSKSSIFFPITSAQKFIPATGAGGGNNN
ncbi:MAG: InlB B-repeat-containing protein [Galactobacillus timonensis]|uniref:InlB B-repeat-containing protein n=1 Tax=Galactobacillus timonensis TaxID=2041840 RepID=UPI002409EFED|nr:InlB B-repeat-containing protein [Galactobacillus timonensis]MDD6599118.1 InlB B-repeat-containing protein [Galactobacillus timonensis]